MERRKVLLAYAAAGILAASLSVGAANAQQTVKIGIVGAKTGPLAAGAAVTHFPGYRMWAEEVNARGGLKLKGGQRKIELIEYDDRTQPGEAIKAVERLATVDKADWIMGMYGTGFNLATAPIFTKHNYPHIPQAMVTDQADALIQRHPNMVIFQGSVAQYGKAAVDVLKKLKDEKKIGNRVAMVNIADAFGIEVANHARPLFKDAGFEIVYDRSYPLGTQDLSPVVKAAKAANPDAFVAWSYPPDSFGLIEQAKIEGLNVKAFYGAVGIAFQGIHAKFGKSAENILGAGGVGDTPELRDFYKRLKAATGVDGDYWGNPMYYAKMQFIQQAIEGVGSLDRAAILAYMQKNKFKTIVGEIALPKRRLENFWTVGQWQNGYFHAVAGVGMKDYAQVRVKEGW
jgi:branched-chain amino acid transport system substrate-binding protein